MKGLHVLLITSAFKFFIVIDVKKSCILYGCKYEFIHVYACILKPYDFLKVCEKPHFNVCAQYKFSYLTH